MRFIYEKRKREGEKVVWGSDGVWVIFAFATVASVEHFRYNIEVVRGDGCCENYHTYDQK